MSMSKPEVKALLKRLSYKDWEIWSFGSFKEMSLWLVWRAPCSKTGAIVTQRSREWTIYPQALTPDALVKTVFLAIKTAEEHETLEFFKLDKKAVFDPHKEVA